MKLYLEKSTINFLLAEDEKEKSDITKKFFKEISKKKLHCVISDLVISEINDAKEPKKSKLLNILKEHNFEILSVDEKAIALGREYVKEGLIPKKYERDAIHIGIASANNCDVIVSWNMNHIVKLKTIKGVKIVNLRLGYPLIEICTPQEVIE